MKIAIFSDCYLDLPGGIPTVINAEKQELERRGHTVYVFSSGYLGASRLARLAHQHIFPVPSCRFWGRGLTPIARRPKIIEKWLLRTHPELKDFDVFYIHYEAGCSIAGLRLARALKIPSVQVMHGREDVGEANLIPHGLRTLVAVFLNWFHSWYLPHPVSIHRDNYLARTRAAAKMWTLMVSHANFADLVITPSQHFKKKLEHYGVTRKIIALPHGVPDELCDAPRSVRTAASAPEPLQLIWHSRVSGEKRILPFLKALTMLKMPYHLHVYGSGADLARAQRYTKKHHLKVTFHGHTPFERIYAQIEKSHLDVLVSYNYDTFGMTLIEAASAGTPVFIVDPDLQEIVPKNGYFISQNPTPIGMAAALNSLASHPEDIEKMSRAMLASRETLKISKKVDELERIFETLKTLPSDESVAPKSAKGAI